MQNNNKIDDTSLKNKGTDFLVKLKMILEKIENDEVRLICMKYNSKDENVRSNNAFLVWEINESDEFTYISSNVETVLNYNSEEMLYKKIYDFMPPDDRDLFISELIKIKNNQSKKFQIKNIFLRKNYKYAILESFGCLTFGDNQNISGLLGISIVPGE